MNIKKGIFKGGLKYFSQMFEEEEQQREIQIGLPTDVKHVAHIGWDGPSTTAPSWMNEFKSQSAPLDGTGSNSLSREDEVSEGKGNAAISSSTREMPGLPKASRVRHPSMDSLASAGDSPPPGSPASTARTIKNKEKDSGKSSGSSRRRKDKASGKHKEAATAGDDGGAHQSSLPNIPKKTSRRKKSKDAKSSAKSSSKHGSRGGSLLGSEDGSTRFNGPGSSMGTLEE